MEYIFVTSEDQRDEDKSISEKITALLEEGYQLYGSPGMCASPKTGTIYYFQAVTRESSA